MRKPHQRIMVFGTFDYFHPGHAFLFSQAKKIATRLIVVVARDQTTLKLKSRTPDHSERARLSKIAAQPGVDRARLGNRGDLYQVIAEEQPDAIGLGYDQWISAAALGRELRKRGLHPKIYRFKALKPDLYKSSLIRQNLGK